MISSARRSRRAARVVAVGDLHGGVRVLYEILHGTRLIGPHGRWTGGRSVLVQVGDLFNRGGGARAALELLFRLRRQARRAGGDVHVLLGNHEVMTALRNELYCTAEEYLAFATPAERSRFEERFLRAQRHMLHDHPPRGPMLPLRPRLEAWKLEHVPGKAAMRRALGPDGAIGRRLRRLPVVVRLGDTVFAHAAIDLRWARLGVDGLNRAARAAWATAPRFWGDLSRASLFRDPNGPLWNRALVVGKGESVRAEVARALELLGARRFVSGHTPSDLVPGQRRGRIAVLHGRRLVSVDVRLSDEPGSPVAALLLVGGTAWEWTPNGRRLLWRE